MFAGTNYKNIVPKEDLVVKKVPKKRGGNTNKKNMISLNMIKDSSNDSLAKEPKFTRKTTNN